MKKIWIAILAILLLLSLSCNLFAGVLPDKPVDQELPGSGARFGEIVFCEDISDQGEPFKPAEHFPAGTTEIWAYFTYDGMQDGQTWRRLWQQGDQVFFDSGAEAWEDGAGGWVAYSISDSESVPLNGRYTLELFIGDQLVQQGAFEVEAPDVAAIAFPAFGPVQFARNVTEQAVTTRIESST